jgi:predicted amidohydrolase
MRVAAGVTGSDRAVRADEQWPPPGRAGVDMVAEARDADIARAVSNGVSIIRADVAGQAGEPMLYGSSGIVDRAGTVLTSARILATGLIVADV